MIPTGSGPSTGSGEPFTAKTDSDAIPLIAAWPITAGQILPERRVNQDRKTPKQKVIQRNRMGPNHGEPGY